METDKLDIPGYSGILFQIIHLAMEDVIAVDPILGSSGTSRTTHGTANSPNVHTTPITHELVLPHDMIRNSDLKGFSDEVLRIAAEHRDKMSEHLVQTLVTTIDASGNTIDAKGEKLSWDHLLKLFEAMELTFDSDGKLLSEPALAMSERTAAILDRIPRPDDFDTKIRAIIEKKKEEFLAQKRTRRIP